MSGGRIRFQRNNVYRDIAERRVRWDRSLQRHGQLVRRRVPAQQLHVPRLRRPVRRCGNMHGIVGHVSHGRLRLERNDVHGSVTKRPVRYDGSLQRHRKHSRRRVPAEQLHVSRIRGPVRRGRDVYGIVGHMPHGRLRFQRDNLHGSVTKRPVRYDGSLQRHRKHLRRRVPAEQLHVSRIRGSVRRRRNMHGVVGCLSGGCVCLDRNHVHRDVARRSVRCDGSLQRCGQHVHR